MIFLTDGEPTVGETRPDRIAHRAGELRGDRRLFTFGIGADVNASLLEQIALEGRGTVTFVRPEESVERAVGVVADRLTRPVATDVKITADGARLYGVQPEQAGRFVRGAGAQLSSREVLEHPKTNATITIEGKGADGPVRWTGQASFPEHSTENSFVARLWAVQRVGYLSAERHRVGGNTELDTELRQLDERCSIPTELTSYLDQGADTHAASRRERSSPIREGPCARPLADRFEAAKTASEQRAVRSVNETDFSSRGNGRDTIRVTGSRTFRLKGAMWVDTRPVLPGRTVSVQPFSAAYFALVQRLPGARRTGGRRRNGGNPRARSVRFG